MDPKLIYRTNSKKIIYPIGSEAAPKVSMEIMGDIRRIFVELGAMIMDDSDLQTKYISLEENDKDTFDFCAGESTTDPLTWEKHEHHLNEPTLFGTASTTITQWQFTISGSAHSVRFLHRLGVKSRNHELWVDNERIKTKEFYNVAYRKTFEFCIGDTKCEIFIRDQAHFHPSYELWFSVLNAQSALQRVEFNDAREKMSITALSGGAGQKTSTTTGGS
eukprot:666887_1